MSSELELKNERIYNAIEDVLRRMHKKVPPEPLMAEIRARYPSPSFFIESNAFMLQRAGLSRLDAFYFTLIPALSRRMARESFGKKPRLNKLSVMSEYLKSFFIGVHVECFYTVMLDARGGLIDAIMIRKGTVDSAPFPMKEMLSLVVQRQARAVVLCHNHPSGTIQPSQEDVACTLRAMNALVSLNVPLLDHVIIAHSTAVSLRDCGLIPTRLWNLQAPDSKLLRDWIDVDLLLDEPGVGK